MTHFFSLRKLRMAAYDRLDGFWKNRMPNEDIVHLLNLFNEKEVHSKAAAGDVQGLLRIQDPRYFNIYCTYVDNGIF